MDCGYCGLFISFIISSALVLNQAKTNTISNEFMDRKCRHMIVNGTNEQHSLPTVADIVLISLPKYSS